LTSERHKALPRTARLVRAARAYAGLTIPGLAERLGLGVATIKRIEAGVRAPRILELWAIAKVCGVPNEWFGSEFSDPDESSPEPDFAERVDERLERIEAALAIRGNGLSRRADTDGSN
jgi:transcriptional regulator with XRE-family HTH domain